MDLTAKIVLLIMLFGLLVVFIWYSRSRPAYAPVRVGSVPPQFVEEDIQRFHTPPKLGWNWWAFFLGPIWYIAEGLWVHAIILILLIGLSGGILWPFAAVYAGAKANETLVDFRLARAVSISPGFPGRPPRRRSPPRRNAAAVADRHGPEAPTVATDGVT